MEPSTSATAAGTKSIRAARKAMLKGHTEILLVPRFVTWKIRAPPRRVHGLTRGLRLALPLSLYVFYCPHIGHSFPLIARHANSVCIEGKKRCQDGSKNVLSDLLRRVLFSFVCARRANEKRKPACAELPSVQRMCSWKQRLPAPRVENSPH